MSQKFDVCVRGGGIVGHALALLLARDRLRVALVRQAQPPNQPQDIRAYALNAASRALLENLRVWPDETQATPVRAMAVTERGTPASLHFDAQDTGGGALAWIVDVPSLESRLHDAVGYQGGITVVAQAQAASLTVVCEGKRSSSREAFGFEFDTQPYPHTALAARLRCEQAHDGVARQWFIDGDIMAWLPMDGPQGNLVALVWSVAHERAPALRALPPEAFAAKVRAAGMSSLGGMQLEGEVAAWPLELSQAKRWVLRHGGSGVALAGDAAHALHPLAGQGLNVGLADVAELARVLHQREPWRAAGDWRLLRRYERARQADVAAMRVVTDGLYGLFAHTDTRLQTLRQWGMQRFDASGPLKRWVARQATGAQHLASVHSL